MMNRDDKDGFLLKPQWMTLPSASSSHSNVHSNGTLSRSRSALNAATDNDHGLHWSSSSAPYRGTESSNSSAVHNRGYISFSRSNRDRDRDRERDRVRGRDRDRERDPLLDSGYCDYSDPVRHKRAERDLPWKSLPLVGGVQSLSLPRRPASALSNSIGSSSCGGGGDGIASFDSEFPSLVADDKLKMSDVGRMSTPGVAAGVQSRVLALSDGHTSTLVEAPSSGGSNGAQVSSVLQTVANTTTVAPSTATALSMAAALAQAPARVHMAPQLTNDLEREKGLMQLGKLVPVVKGQSSEKSKSKGARRSNYSAPKVSQFSNHQVLNRDKNGVDSTTKDGPTLSTSSRDAPSIGGGVQVMPAHHLQSTVNSRLKVNDKGERRPLSQVQGRHDFFNSIRKKEMLRNFCAANLETDCVTSSSASNLLAPSCEHITGASASQEDVPAVSTFNAELSPVENGDSGACDESFEMLPPPDEKEAAFLRSLGWEENAVEEPITQMEIICFLNKYSEHSACTKLKAKFPELLHACSS